MDRKEVLNHFRGLADMAGRPLRTEYARSGVRVVYNGRSVMLPGRGQKIRHVERLEHRLGLR